MNESGNGIKKNFPTGIKVGQPPDYFEIEEDGTDVRHGAATAWEDLSGALLAARLDTASGRLHYDYFNAGVKVDANARYPEEPMVIAMQARHEMQYSSVEVPVVIAKPHFHWLQQQAAIPNILLGYKITNYGSLTTFETDWSNYTFSIPSAHIWTYSAGCLAQISRFPDIDLSAMTLSSSIDVVLFRDSANVSGLFAGADPVAAAVTIKYNDSHVKNDMIGSREEITK